VDRKEENGRRKKGYVFVSTKKAFYFIRIYLEEVKKYKLVL